MPLFIESPNGRTNVGLNRDKRIINPSATSASELAMFEFVGALCGIALRTKHTLPLNLASTVWKRLLGDPLAEEDLAGVDKLCLQVWRVVDGSRVVQRAGVGCRQLHLSTPAPNSRAAPSRLLTSRHGFVLVPSCARQSTASSRCLRPCSKAT